MSESNLQIYHLYLDFNNYCNTGRASLPCWKDVASSFCEKDEGSDGCRLHWRAGGPGFQQMSDEQNWDALPEAQVMSL